MKKLLFALLIGAVFMQCTPTSDTEQDVSYEADTAEVKETAEQAAVKDAVVKAYVEGIHINRDTAAVLKGFHPSFIMMVNGEGDKVKQVPIADWAAGLQASKDKNPEPPEHTTTHEFSMVDVTGNTAVAKVEIYRDGEHIFTDYLSLYNKNDDWKIVGKVFHRH